MMSDVRSDRECETQVPESRATRRSLEGFSTVTTLAYQDLDAAFSETPDHDEHVKVTSSPATERSSEQQSEQQPEQQPSKEPEDRTECRPGSLD
jgi:hypothetical protein